MASLKGKKPASRSLRAGMETFLFGDDDASDRVARLFRDAGFRFRLNTRASKFFKRRVEEAVSMPANLSGLGFFDEDGFLIGAVTRNLGAEGSRHPWTFRYFDDVDGVPTPAGHFYVSGPREIVKEARTFFYNKLAQVVAYRTPTRERKAPRRVSLVGSKTAKKTRPRGRVRRPDVR
jgi:hypothetical protein